MVGTKGGTSRIELSPQTTKGCTEEEKRILKQIHNEYNLVLKLGFEWVADSHKEQKLLKQGLLTATPTLMSEIKWVMERLAGFGSRKKLEPPSQSEISKVASKVKFGGKLIKVSPDDVSNFFKSIERDERGHERITIGVVVRIVLAFQQLSINRITNFPSETPSRQSTRWPDRAITVYNSLEFDRMLLLKNRPYRKKGPSQWDQNLFVRVMSIFFSVRDQIDIAELVTGEALDFETALRVALKQTLKRDFFINEAETKNFNAKLNEHFGLPPVEEYVDCKADISDNTSKEK